MKIVLRNASITFASLILCTGLFYQMTFLISGKMKFDKSQKQEPIMLFSAAKSRKATSKKRALPKKPKMKTIPNKMLSKAKAAPPTDAPKPQMAMNFSVPQLQFGTGVGVAAGAGPAQSGGTRDAMAIVKVEPQMPRTARVRGIEGYVVLGYSIDPSGNVQDVAVVNSRPRRIFDGAAKQALVRWKFKPRIVEGKAVAQKNLKVKFDFKIRD